MKTGLFERSSEVVWIMDILKALKIGEIAAYSVLSDAIGKNVQKEGRAALQSARRILMREIHMAFDCVRNSGVKRLDNVGVLGTMASHISRIRNASKRAEAVSTCITSFEDLSDDQKTELLTKQSYFRVIGSITREKTIKKIEGSIDKIMRPLNLGEMLKALEGKNGEDEKG